MARKIFISYRRKDKDLVFPFVERINQALNLECWIDMEGIESGEAFEEVIMQAIDDCQVVLFMMSDSSLKSTWTKREIYYAEDEGKRIVPILIDGEKLRGWFKFHFGNVDYISVHSEEQQNKLIRNLRNWLGVAEEKEGKDVTIELAYNKAVDLYRRRDLSEAVKWYRKAAEQGLSRAKTALQAMQK